MATLTDFIYRLKSKTTLCNIMNSTTGEYCSVALILMVTLKNFYKLKGKNHVA